MTTVTLEPRLGVYRIAGYFRGCKFPFRNNFRGSKICGDSGHAQPGTAQTLARAIDLHERPRKSLIDDRDCQQHVGSERELSRAFPHRTQWRF